MWKFWKRRLSGAVAETSSSSPAQPQCSPIYCTRPCALPVNSQPINMTARKAIITEGRSGLPRIQQQQQQQRQHRVHKCKVDAMTPDTMEDNSRVKLPRARRNLLCSFVDADKIDCKVINTTAGYFEQASKAIASVQRCVTSTGTQTSTPPPLIAASEQKQQQQQVQKEQPLHRKKYIQYYNKQDFDKLQILGEGTYGIVYKCIHRPTQKFMAMKRLRLSLRDDRVVCCYLREISLLSQMRHLNIVRMLGLIKDQRGLSILFEYLDMDLRQYLDSLAPNLLLHEKTVQQFMYQLTKAIEYCHGRNIMHRDLKPSNLLIDFEHGILKVADFGLGRSFTLPVGNYTNEVVTVWYRAPELLFGQKKYTSAIDIWSIGCIFAEMSNRRPLFPGRSDIHQINTIFSIMGTPTTETWPNFNLLLENCSIHIKKSHGFQLHRCVPYLGEDGFDLLFRILSCDPIARYNATEILQHRYFHGLNVPKYYR